MVSRPDELPKIWVLGHKLVSSSVGGRRLSVRIRCLMATGSSILPGAGALIVGS